MTNLYLLENPNVDRWAPWMSCRHAIVSADSERDARLIHPHGYEVMRKDYREYTWTNGAWRSDAGHTDDEWPAPDAIAVKHIGVATDDVQPGTVLIAYFVGEWE